jgi:hypothetical protein
MTRNYKKWTINEEISLIREYELLHMFIEDIANKHKRSPLSIVYKLYSEGLVTDITVEHYKSAKNSFKSLDNSKKIISDEYDEQSYDNDSSSDYVYEEESSDDDDEDYDVEDYDVEEEEKQDDVEDYDVEEEEDKEEEDEYADMPELVDIDDISEVNKLTDRVWNLETSVNEIGTMIKTLFDELLFSKKNKNKSKKLAPLRKI